MSNANAVDAIRLMKPDVDSIGHLPIKLHTGLL
jgi:hypothetical protein